MDNLQSIEIAGTVDKLNDTSLNAFVKGIDGLTLSQAQAALSTRALTDAQKEQILTSAGLLQSAQAITLEEVKQMASSASLSAQKKEEILTTLQGAYAEGEWNIQSLEAIKAKGGEAGAIAESILAKKAENAENVKNIAGRKALTASLKEELATRLALMASNPAVWIAGIAAVSVGLIALQEKFSKSLEECTEELEGYNSEFDTAQSSIESLETELKTCTSRLDELQKLADNGTISIIEQEEYERLQKTNDELERNIRIEREKAQLSAIDAAKSADETLTKKVTSNYIRGDVASYEGVILEDQILSVSPQEELEASIAEYNKLQEQIDTLNQSYDNGSISADDYNKQLIDLTDQQTKARTRASEMSDILVESEQAYANLTNAGAELTTTQTANYNSVKQANEAYNEFLSTINGVSEKNLDTTENIDEAINKLDDSVKKEIQHKVEQGKFTIDDIPFEMKLSLTENGINVDDIVQEIKSKFANGSEEIIEAIEYNRSDMIEAINATSDAFNILDEVYADIQDKGAFDFTKLSKKQFTEAFAGLEKEYEDFIETISANPDNLKACEDAFNNLTTAYINQQGILKNLSKENAQVAISMLENMGIANAKEVVLGELALQEELAANGAEQLMEMTYAEADAFIQGKEGSEELKASLAQLALEKIHLNGIRIDTADEVQSLINLAGQASVATVELQKLSAAKQALEKYEVYQDIKRQYGTDTRYYNPKVLEQAEKDAKEAQALLDKINNGTYQFKYEYERQQFKPTPIKYTGGDKSQSDRIKEAGKSTKEAGDSAKEAKDEFEELFDFFERRVKVLDNAFDLLKANLDNVTGSFAKNNLLGAQQDILETKIDEYTAAASMYQQKANEALSKLDSDIQEKIKAGAVNLTEFVGDANKEVVETIKDFETWADKVSNCNQELAELGKTISQIELNKFENIMQDFNDQYNIRDSGKDIINKQIELFKESGQVIGEPFYQELIRQTEKQIAGGEQEKNKLVEQLNDSLSSGKITVGSEEWVKEIGYLSDLEGQILDNKKAVEEYDNQILQLHWDSFDREKQQFSNLNDEISNLKDLLGDSDVADENGTWTKEGIAQLGLMAQQYELAEYNVKRYNDEIEWLNKEYLAGNYSTTEYADKLAELKKEQWDSVKASESAKDAIVELNKARIDIAIKGIEKEIDAFKKLTEAQIEALEASKDLHDYEKSISEKNKSIVQLQRQLAAMANDTSATAMAKKAKLEEQLAEAKEALEEEQYQHSIDAQKEALNKQAEDYEQSKNYEIESLQKTLEERETLIAESFKTVKMNAETVGLEIDRIAQEHGITVSQALTDPWKKGELAIASYGQTLTPQTSSFIEILGGITRAIESIKIEADQTALKLSELFGSHTNRLVDDLNAAYTSADNLNKMTSGLQSAFSELFGGNYNTGGISGALNSIKGAIDGVTSAANAASQAIANMGAAKVQSSTPPPGQTSKPSRVEMFGSGATATFVTKDDSGKTHGVYKTVEEALKKKKKKYASGTRNAKGGLRVTDEQGNELVLPKLAEGRYAIGNAGDQILTKVQTDNIFDWSKFNPADLVPYNMFGSLNMTPPEIRTRDVNNNTPVQIGNLISVQGNIDSSNIKQMESIANKAVDNLVYKMSKGIKYGRI